MKLNYNSSSFFNSTVREENVFAPLGYTRAVSVEILSNAAIFNRLYNFYWTNKSW